MKRNILSILIVLLVGISLFSLWQYISILSKRQSLLESINQIRSDISRLEMERRQISYQLDEKIQLLQRLSEEKQVLQDNIKVTQEKFAQAQRIIEQLRCDINSLTEENLSLKKDKRNLTEENASLKARFRSINELNRAIKELKRQMRKVRVEMRQKVSADRAIEGNRGYIIKDGKPTLGSRVKIEVIPVQ